MATDTSRERRVDLTMAIAVWRRNAAVYRRTWLLNIFPNFFEPVLYLVGMGLGLGAYLEGGMAGAAYIAFIGPGLMASAAMNGATFETTYNMFIKMHFQRLYDAFLSTPATLTDIALGELLWAMTRASFYGGGFLVVLVAMTLLGYPVLTSPWALLLPLVILLTGALFALIGEAFTALVRSIDLYSYYYTLFITPLFLFSGIFFPVDRFPYGEAIAWMTPLYHAVRLSRGLAQGPLGVEHLVSAAWMVVACLGLMAVVPRLLRRQLARGATGHL